MRSQGSVIDKTLLKDYNAKVNWQASGSDMVSVLWFLGSKQKFGRLTGTRTGCNEAPTATWNQDNSFPDNPFHGLFKIEDNHVFSPSFFVNAKYAYYGTGFELAPAGGLDTAEGLNIVTSEAYGSSKQYQSIRPQSTLNADASYFRGSHEFKFGFAYRRASVVSSSLLPGNGIEARTETARGTDSPASSASWSLSYKGSYNSLYLQDTFTSGRLTLQGGVRWDLQKSENAPSTAKANPLFPEILPDLVYDGSGTKISWSDVSPRVGVTYALDESRKTVLRGNFSIFTQQLAMPDVTVVNPLGGVARIDYRWDDRNADGLINGRDEVDIAGGPLGTPVNAELSTVNELDPDYRAPRDAEFLVGIERELAPNLAVGATYTYRRTTRAPYLSYIGVNGTDWVPCESVSGNGYSAPCLDVGPANAAALDANSGGQRMSNRPGYHRNFSGVELTAVKRLSNRWMGRLGFGYNNWTESFDGTGGIQNPMPLLYDNYGYYPFQHGPLGRKKSGGPGRVLERGFGDALLDAVQVAALGERPLPGRKGLRGRGQPVRAPGVHPPDQPGRRQPVRGLGPRRRHRRRAAPRHLEPGPAAGLERHRGRQGHDRPLGGRLQRLQLRDRAAEGGHGRLRRLQQDRPDHEPAAGPFRAEADLLSLRN